MANVQIALVPTPYLLRRLPDWPVLNGEPIWGTILTFSCGLILLSIAFSLPSIIPMLALSMIVSLIAVELLSGAIARVRCRSRRSAAIQTSPGCRIFVEGRPEDVDELLSQLSATRPARSSWYVVPPRVHANAGVGILLLLYPKISGNVGLAGPFAAICFAVALLPIAYAWIVRRRWLVRDGCLVEESCGPFGRHRVYTAVSLKSARVTISFREPALFVMHGDAVVATVDLRLLMYPFSLVISVVAAVAKQDGDQSV